MVVCVSAICRQMFENECLFCPYCGADNRPPGTRIPVPPHPHDYIHGGNYCWRCGQPDEMIAQREQDARRGKLFTLFGAIVIGIAWVVAAVSSAQDDANYTHVLAVRQRLRAEGKLENGAQGPQFQFSPLGAFPLLIGIAGAASTVYGAVMWINSRKQNEPFG